MIIQWSYGSLYADAGGFDAGGGSNSNANGNYGSIPPPAPNRSAEGYIAMGGSLVSRGMGGEQFTYELVRSVNQGVDGLLFPANPSLP